ncbi:MAG: phytanoyl-CoA dioxygenase family protein [Hyphomicrobiaceae bacterium]
MLSREQTEFYNDNGYLLVEDAVTPAQLEQLRTITSELIDQSRTLKTSDERFDLDDGHSAERPRLTRIKLPHKLDPYYWEVLQNSRMTDVLRDILGNNVMLQTAKLNTKAPGGGQAVEWHQDWAFYPATNDSMLALGLMLEDVNLDNGPLQVIPGSHKGPVLAHTMNGVFCGAVDPDDPEFHHDKAVTLTGRAGSMTVHHVRMLHGSAPNVSDRDRMILFYECHAADAWPLLGAPSYLHTIGQRKLWEDIHTRVILGEPTMVPRVEQVPVRIPMPPAPDSGSIFKTQKSGGAKSAFAA